MTAIAASSRCQFKAEYKEKVGADFPTDPKEQLMGAVNAVFRSWNNPRAIVYRRMNDIPSSWGTAVNVQAMVFGNMGDNCGTGVAFSRNPATGEKKIMGEFLVNAQGEDVVAGVRTPMPISQMAEKFPEAYIRFEAAAKALEDHYHDMQDMEFTVENGKLYMLQTRNGKRTATAALKIACDLVDEGQITEQQAVLMIDARNLDSLLHPAPAQASPLSLAVLAAAMAAATVIGGAAPTAAARAAETDSAGTESGIELIPVPKEMSADGTELTLTDAVNIEGADAADADAVSDLKGFLSENGITVNEQADEADTTIILGESDDEIPALDQAKERLGIDGADGLAEEGYVLSVRPGDSVGGTVVIEGKDGDGTFYGVQTLRQLADEREDDVILAAADIRDEPSMSHNSTSASILL